MTDVKAGEAVQGLGTTIVRHRTFGAEVGWQRDHWQGKHCDLAIRNEL
jgi:hypothetical protein